METLEHDCMLAVAMFPDWTVEQHCRAWRKLHRRKVKKGLRIALPRPVQVFEVTGVMHYGIDRERKRAKATAYYFKSDCVICGRPYGTKVHKRFIALTRTCEAHRGTLDRRKPKPAKEIRERRNPALDAILAELALAADSTASIAYGDMLARCVKRMAPPAPGKRDTRRQRIARTIAQVSADDCWPIGIAFDGLQFVFAEGAELV